MQTIHKVLKGIALLTLALAFGVVSGHAQSTTPISVGTAYCGVSYNYCYSVPVTIGGVQGTMWVDSPYFILFRMPTGTYTLQITRVSNVIVTNGVVTQETIAFEGPADPNADDDTDTITGQITLNFSQRRACGRGCYWLATVLGGSGTQSITQD